MSIRRSVLLSVAFALTTLVPPSAFASHPSVATWSASIVEDDTPACLTITVPDDAQLVLDVDNQCEDFLNIMDVGCEPIVCEPPGSLGVENGEQRRFGAFDFGLDFGQVDEGDTVEITIPWTLNQTESGTIVLSATYEGFTGGEHNFDMGGVSDAGIGDGDTGGTADAGTSPDADQNGQPNGGSGGNKADPSGCGGCSTASSPAAAGLLGLLLIGLARVRR